MFKKMVTKGLVLVATTIVSQIVIERLEKRSLKQKTGSTIVEFKKKGDEPVHKTVEETLDELDKIQKDYNEGNLASE